MEPRCATHPDVPAAFTCPRCGTFACGPCGVHLVEEKYGATQRVCVRCRDVVAQALRDAAERPSTRAGVVFWLALALGMTPLGMAVWVFAAIELRAIRQGRAPRAGRAWVWAGVALSCLWALAVIAVVASFR